MTTLQTSFPPKFVGSSLFADFDFASVLDVGETVSSAVVTSTVYSGTDASPSSMISGSASASGTTVTQLITGGVEGVMYYLTCTITTSNGQTLIMTGFLAVIPNVI